MTRTIRDLWRRLRSKHHDDPDAMTPAQVRAELDALAQEHLGVTGDEALAMLDRGELDGTAIEVELKMCRFLLGEDRTPRQKNTSHPPAGSMRSATI